MQAAVSRLGGTSRIVPTRLQPEASPKRSGDKQEKLMWEFFPENARVWGDITMANIVY